MDNTNTSRQLAQIAVKSMSAKKASRISVLNISNISILADYIVIASGTNKNQIQAICDNIRENLTKIGIHYRSLEGYDNASWILMDYNDLLINIFDTENRDFYDLEHIYADAVHEFDLEKEE